MKLVILIPTHNRNELLERTLNSLSECEFPNEYEKTIVIENGGEFGASNITDKFKNINVQYLYSEEGNKSLALNKALTYINDDTFIFFTDDDVRFNQNILIEYVNTSKKFKNYFIYGGPMGVDYDEGAPESWLIEYLPRPAKGWSLGNKQLITTDNFTFLGCNWGAFAEDIKKYNGFDANFGPGDNTLGVGQESSMQRSMFEKGWKKCYIPDALVWHYVPKIKSNKEFALRHIYKTGVMFGAKYAVKRFLFYYPLEFYKIFLYIIYVFFKSRFNLFNKTRGEKLNFIIKFKKSYLLGLIKGFNYARKKRS